MLLFSWPLLCRVCTNNEVVMLQPRTVTPPYLGYVVNFYVSYSNLLNPLRPSPSFFALCLIYIWGGGGWPHLPLATLLSTSVGQTHGIILPPRLHLSLSQHPEIHCSLTHFMAHLCPCLLLPRHAFRISNASHLPLPKSLLTEHSASLVIEPVTECHYLSHLMICLILFLLNYFTSLDST